MEKVTAKDILLRYKAGQTTADEKALVEKWMLFGINEAIDLSDEELLLDLIEIRMRLDLIPSDGKSKMRKLWPRIAIAASVLCLLSLGLYIYFHAFRNSIQQTTTYAHDILPGKNFATLTLTSGKRVTLSDTIKGKVAEESGITIVKKADGQLVYEVTGQASENIQYNTLETPKGGQHQILLPDGTHVWLNAASSLRFPTSFNALAHRQVELHGEAYFEVAKDKEHPFIVKTIRQEVEVLGTHFNINSYADEAFTKTTLLEGSVRVSGKRANIILKPGQQSEFDGNSMQVKEVNTENAIAWKNGEFSFKNEELQSIMRKVSRWYNVEVVFKNQASVHKTFSGSVSRFDHISKVLRILEMTGGAEFKIEGRKVIIL